MGATSRKWVITFILATGHLFNKMFLKHFFKLTCSPSYAPVSCNEARKSCELDGHKLQQL